MEITFSKYQGTGNDFIMIDGVNQAVNLSKVEIQQICKRRFGVGADGLIIIKKHAEVDFEMDYYNADGSQSFCGNGSRCAQAFAYQLGIISEQSQFLAIDGIHRGKQVGEGFATQMADVNRIQKIGDDFFIDTGSPHYIKYVENVDAVDVFMEGRAIRNSRPYKEKGTNVNFVSEFEGGIKVRTYERGVENETFSCGTGVTAAAISYLSKSSIKQKRIKVHTLGGKLSVELNPLSEQEYTNIWLIGPALEVFSGSIDLRN